MKDSETDIIKQLFAQQIRFEIISRDQDPKYDAKLQNIRTMWKDTFIKEKKVPYVDDYLWHVFSYGLTDFIEGDNATYELRQQFASQTVIFNEIGSYLLFCFDKIPIIEMKNYIDDVYVSHHNMKWTYVLPHDSPQMGPYFKYKS